MIVSALLALILLHAVWIRLPLASEGLWSDEAVAVYIASAPSSSEFLRRLEVNDFNPPLFHLLLAGWGRLAGWEEAPLKLYALAWGILALGAVGLLAASLFGWRGAVLGLAFAAANPLLFSQSGELRPYTLSVAGAALALLFVCRMWRDPAPPRFSQVLILAAVLTIVAYSHYAGLPVVAVIGVAGVGGLLAGVKRKQSLGIAVAAAAAGLVFLPWLPVLRNQMRIGIPYDRPMAWSEKLDLMRVKLGVVSPALAPHSLQWIVIAGAVTLTLLAMLAPIALKREFRALAFPLVLLAGSALAVFLVMGLKANNMRYVIVAAGLASALTAGILVTLVMAAAESRNLLTTLASLVLIVLSLGFSWKALAVPSKEVRISAAAGVPKSGFRSLCDHAPPAAADLVVVAPDFRAATFWYYCGRRSDVRGFAQWDEPMIPDWKSYGARWLSPDAVSGTLERIEQAPRASGARRLVFLFATPPGGTPLHFPTTIRKLRQGLAERYRAIGDSTFPGRIERVERIEFRLGER